MGNSIQKIAFQPHTPTPLHKRFFIESDNYKIPIMYYPSSNSKKVLIYSHGNASDLGDMAEYLIFLNKLLGISVVGYEYLGYGFSEVKKSDEYCGSLCTDTSCMGCPSANKEKASEWESPLLHGFPSEEGCYKSLWMTYNWVKSDLGVADEDIILMGQSIGSGPTCEIAAKTKCGAVILLTPFRSAVKVVTDTSLGYFVDFFQNEDKICNIDAPILIVHGTDDEVIHPSHATQLVDVLNEAKRPHTMLWVEGATHNNIVAFDECSYGMLSFINEL